MTKRIWKLKPYGMVNAFILTETLFLPSMIYSLITLSIYKGKSIRNEVKLLWISEIANLRTSFFLKDPVTRL
jgi:hypothetical protein